MKALHGFLILLRARKAEVKSMRMKHKINHHPRQRNAIAKLLRTGAFQPKRVEMKTRYRRKAKHTALSDTSKEN